MRIRFGGRVWLAVTALLFCSVAAWTQTAGTGALTGTVRDSSGGAIPNATVTLTNTATAQSRTTTAGPDGTYKVSLLPPGNYRVKFEAPGFATVEVPSVQISVTETPVLDRALNVGSQRSRLPWKARWKRSRPPAPR